MKQETVVVTLQDHCSGRTIDLELRLDLTALELFEGLREALGWRCESPEEYYLCAEGPIALLRGSRTLREFGVRDGTTLHYVRGEAQHG